MKTLKHLFTALLLMCATVATAHNFELGGIYYDITNATNKTVEVTYQGDSYSSNYNEYTGDVVIPESVTYNGTTYSVTSIGDYAFANCYGFTSIVIPNSVTSIGSYAFFNCSGLAGELVIPDGVTSIGRSAFSGCNRLTSVEIGNSVTSIGERAFNNCFGLISIVVDGNNTKYDSRENCNAIIETETNTLIIGCKNTVIPGSVTSIGDNAFLNYTDLTCIEIPGSVTSIGNSAFNGCTGLTSIEIPNSVTSIGGSAFRRCYGLTNVIIGNSVTSIGEEAFYNCSGLTSIEIPNSVTSIGNSAFYGCSDLETLYISNTIESIGDYAFAECNNILDIKMGSKKAITASENVFSNDAYINACLYVPTGRKFAYEKATPWKNFYIVEMDFTGIDNVKAENGNVKTVYDLSGRAVKNPANGVYIINGKKVLVK